MKIYTFPGIGLSPSETFDPFNIKNVRVIGDLNVVARKMHRKIAQKLITKPYTQEVAEPFPFEAGLGYFARVYLDGSAEGFFFCLSGNHRKGWVYGVGSKCYDIATEIMSYDCKGREEALYIAQVKQALGLT